MRTKTTVEINVSEGFEEDDDDDEVKDSGERGLCFVVEKTRRFRTRMAIERSRLD